MAAATTGGHDVGMPLDPSTVLIVDDNADARAALRRQLEFAGTVVVAEAATQDEAIELALDHEPDAVLVELERRGLDGLAAVAAIAVRAPGSPVIAIAAGDELTPIRKAMLAGARAYLCRPFVGDEVAAVVREVRRRTRAGVVGRGPNAPRPDASGVVIAVTGPGGGSGKTTLAINVALAATLRGASTVLVDGDLSFGDVAVMLDIAPNGGTLADLAVDGSGLDVDPHELAHILRRHSSGLGVVLGPGDPRTAAALPAPLIAAVASALARDHDAVVVDLPGLLDDGAIATLDTADAIVIPFVPHAAGVNGVGAYLSLIEQLGLGDRAVPVVNRHDWFLGLAADDVARALGRPLIHLVSHDEGAAAAINAGRPLVTTGFRSAYASDVARLAGDLVGLPPNAEFGEVSLLQRAWQGMRGWSPGRHSNGPHSVSDRNEMGHPSQYE